MKKQIITLITILIASISFAQSGFNYKALITDNGNVLANTPVDIKFTITNIGGPPIIWQEVHNGLTTDDNGIVTAIIGEGTRLDGVVPTFDEIGFKDPYHLAVEVNINGTGFQTISNSNLKFVPYAHYAKSAGAVDFNDIYNMPADIADGDDVNDADHDSTNEIQTLSVSGNQLTISNGNTVTLPTGSSGDQWGSQVVQSDASLNGDGTSANPLGVNLNSSVFNSWDKNASDDVQSLNDLSDAITSNDDLFLGELSGNTSSGGYNIGIGKLALSNVGAGNHNIAIGYSALGSSGSFNTVVGSGVMMNNSIGRYNVAIGGMAGFDATGNNNVFIGFQAGYNETGNDKLYIANSDTTTPLIYGDFASSELAVNGSLAVKDGTQGAGKIFTSDANGKGTWQDVSNWDTDASDDFSGDYNDLTNTPVLFYEYGTNNPATSINQNIKHYGDMILGLTFSSLGAGVSSLRINRRKYNDDDSFGISNKVSGTGTGIHYGIYNSLSGTGTGIHYGTFNLVSNSSDASHYGTYNSLVGDGNGMHVGNYNSLYGTSNGVQIGTYSNISNSGDASHYGIKNYLSGSGTGDKYASYNKISNGAGGKHYALYAEATKDAPDVYAGYFVGDVNVKTGDLNVEDKLTAPDSGDTDMKAYVYGNITSGGNKRASGSSDGYTISRTGNGEYTIVFNTAMTNVYAYTATATISYGSGIGFIRTRQVNATNMIVYTYDKTGVSANRPFTFVVYKK